MSGANASPIGRSHQDMALRLLGFIFVLVLPLAISRAQSGGQEYIVVLKDGQSVESVNKAHGTHTVRRVANTSIYLIKADDNDADSLKKLKRDKSIDIVE